MPPVMNWPDTDCPGYPGKTARDLLETIITLAQAEKDYGLVLNPATLEIEGVVGGRQS